MRPHVLLIMESNCRATFVSIESMNKYEKRLKSSGLCGVMQHGATLQTSDTMSHLGHVSMTRGSGTRRGVKAEQKVAELWVEIQKLTSITASSPVAIQRVVIYK